MDYLKNFITNDTAIIALNDVLKIGALLLGGRLLSKNSIMDTAWMSSTVFILIGFVVYHIIVRHIIDPMNFVDMITVRMAFEDVFKFGIAFLVARIIAKRNDLNSVFERGWASEISIILAGLAIYDIVFSKLIMRFGHIGLFGISLYSLSDVFKFGTMLIVIQLFNGGSLNDPDWIKETAGALGAVAIYDIFSVKRIKASISME